VTRRLTTVDVQGLSGDERGTFELEDRGGDVADLAGRRICRRSGDDAPVVCGQGAVGKLTGGLALAHSEITVKACRRQVMGNMQVQSLADLVRVAGALDLPLVRASDTKVSTYTIVQ
jgi:uncharacterized protein (DUF2345 family)